MPGDDVVLFSCPSLVLATGLVPSLTLTPGDLVCLHILRSFEPGKERDLVSVLNAKRKPTSIAEIVLAEPMRATAEDASSSASTVLQKRYRIGRDLAMRLADDVAISPDRPVNALSLTARMLLGLELAARESMVVAFSTAGLDPTGAESVYSRARARTTHAFIHLSYFGAECECKQFGVCVPNPG